MYLPNMYVRMYIYTRHTHHILSIVVLVFPSKFKRYPVPVILTLRDRTDGRSAYNPHVSKACNLSSPPYKAYQPARGLAHWFIGYFNIHVSIIQLCTCTYTIHYCTCYPCLTMYPILSQFRGKLDESKCVMP